MINESFANDCCCEDISKIENYGTAIADTQRHWVCHHRGGILPCGRYTRSDLKKFKLYYNRPAIELIFLTKSEHSRIHTYGVSRFKGKDNPMYHKNIKDYMTEEEYDNWKSKHREYMKGNTFALGKHWNLSEDTKTKMCKPKSEEHKKHISENNCAHRKEIRDKISKSHIGIRPDDETRKKISIARFKCAENKFRNSREYAEKETILSLYESGLSVHKIQSMYDRPNYVKRVINECKSQGVLSNI